MALSPSATSPLGGPYRTSHPNRSPSPQQPMSKKDKKRNQYWALGEDLRLKFAEQRESQYRDQLVALQRDMNMITHCDVTQPELLDDSPEAIAQALEQITTNNPYQSELSSLAGRWYPAFLQEMNSTKEAKELAIIGIHNNHEKKLKQLEDECAFKMQLASTEYEHMINTLRERLTQQLNSRRQRLLKEKEQLDIADTNALLLHPSQFTITNPTTPAGQPTSRKTRTTRRGDPDLNGLQEASNKRKRKFVDDDVGSPVRHGTSTPAGRGGRPGEVLAHQTAPLYTIDSLFTEKELNFQSHQAQIATRHFFSTSQKDIDASSRGKRKKGDDGDAAPADTDSSVANDTEAEAPSMERTASQNVHVTRSTRTNGGLNGLAILSEIADKTASRPALPYATLHSHQSKSGTFLPPASRLLDHEIDEDLRMIAEISQRDEDVIDLDMVKEAIADTTTSRSRMAPDFPAYLDVHLREVDPRNHG